MKITKTIKKEGKKSIMPFIKKTYSIVNNPKNASIVRWNTNGTAFIIENMEKFNKVILPLHFKHNKFSSFMRQLNMYGFHKQRLQQNVFFHPQFIKGEIDKIKNIRRKIQLKEKKNVRQSKNIQDVMIQNKACQKQNFFLYNEMVSFFSVQKITNESLFRCTNFSDIKNYSRKLVSIQKIEDNQQVYNSKIPTRDLMKNSQPNMNRFMQLPLITDKSLYASQLNFD